MLYAAMQLGRDCLCVDIDGLTSHIFTYFSLETQFRGAAARMRELYDAINRKISNPDSSFNGDEKKYSNNEILISSRYWETRKIPLMPFYVESYLMVFTP